MLSSLKKDNTGYHLKHLFIGSEGTLGFVTKVAIQCAIKPKSQNLAFLGLKNYDNVLKTFRHGKEHLSEILSAVEVIDSYSMNAVKEHLGLHSPIGDYPFYLLLETSGSREEHDQEKLYSFVETALSKEFILNGTVATEPSKFKVILTFNIGNRKTLPLFENILLQFKETLFCFLTRMFIKASIVLI